MPEAFGRNFIRSPFPLDGSSHLETTPAYNEASNLSDEQKRRLADVETQKQSAISPEPLPAHRFSIADVETQKNQVVTTDSFQSSANAVPVPRFPPDPDSIPKATLQQKDIFLANAVRQYPDVQPQLPLAQASTPALSVQQPSKKRERRSRTRRQKAQLLIITILWLFLSCLIIFELISAFVVYKQMQDGIAQLQAAENVFHTSSGSGMAVYFDASRLRQAQADINAAQGDFASLSDRLDHDGSIALAANLLPEQISTARALGHIAVTGMRVAQQLLKTAQAIAPSVAPAFQKSSSSPPAQGAPLAPYLTVTSYQQISTALGAILPLVHQMAGDAQRVALNSLPMSSKQRDTLASMLPLLPILDTALPRINSARDVLSWFLGIDSQRTYLLEPMDSAELRATGGFTGQFAELSLNGVHMAPLKFSNIGKYEEDHSAEGSPPDPVIYPKVVGQSAPKPYANWWPIGNFGLRDANLSADFPTSATIIMDRYKYEFGKSLDGVILFTPALIEHVLHVTGPIAIPLYHEVITEQNLEDLLHYYQLNNTGIRREEIIEHVNDNQIARKLFTQRVTQALMSTVTHLPVNKMFALANEMLLSMKSKDLQMYVTNPQLEALLGTYGSTASLDRSANHDGLFIVQSNISASKASQYVTTSMQDAITLDDAGGATHSLQLTLDYQQKGDVYGFDTYRDYVRIYVPPGSRLLAGNGFDQYDRPHCGDEQSGYTLCQPDVYGDGSLLCTPPVEIGYATSYLNDPYQGKDHPLDVTGPPQNLQSDEQGRTMLGGWVVIPKNCTMKVTLSWYVPPSSKQPYSLLWQAQASVYASLDLTVHPSAQMCVQKPQLAALHFSQRMDGTDLSFTVKRQGTTCALVAS